MKTYIAVTMALMLASCAQKEEKEFIINGKIEELENGFVKLIDEEQNILDSVTVENGEFVLKGSIEQPRFVYIFAYHNSGENCIFSKLLLENKHIIMEGNATESRCEYSGATLNDEYRDYVRHLLQIPYQKEVQNLYNDLAVAIANENGQLKSEIENRLSITRDSVISELMRYKPDAPRSQAAAALVYDQTSIHGLEEKKYAVSKFDKNFTDSYYLNKLREEIADNKPDIHNAENLLDYQGAYQGTLPAADGIGIKTSITFEPNKTYMMQTEHIGKKNIFTEKGCYNIEKDVITLTSSNGDKSYYKVEKGRIRKLNNDKHIITGTLGNKYILYHTSTLTTRKSNMEGTWIEQMPVNKQYVQGFKLYPNGNAESIGTTSLMYKKWMIEDDRLILTGKSVSKTQTYDYSDTLNIISCSPNHLVLGKEGDKGIQYRVEYTKQ